MEVLPVAAVEVLLEEVEVVQQVLPMVVEVVEQQESVLVLV